MPIQITDEGQSGQTYATAIVGDASHPAPVRVDPSIFFGTDFVDEKGWLKGQVPLKRDGTLVAAPAAVVFGVTTAPRKIAKSNLQVDLDAVGPLQIIVFTICQVNQAIMEDNFGRALTADEVSAIDASQGIVRINAGGV